MRLFNLFITRTGLMLFFLIINAAIGVVVFNSPQLYADDGGIFFSFAVVSVVISVYYFKNCLLFQARLVLLVTIGYFAGAVKMINPHFFFSPIGLFAQTFEIGVKMFGLTSVALLGAAGGLLLSAGSLVQYPDFKGNGVSKVFSSPCAVFVFSSILVLITGELSARSYGPLVFNAVYGSGEGKGQLLGNLQSIGVVALTVAIISGRRIPAKWMNKFLYFLGFYFLGWGILLRGGRLEVISGILAILVAIPAINGKIFKFKMWHYGLLVAAALFFEAWGNLRSTLSTASTEDLTGSYTRLADSGIYFAGTISGIATTFSNVLHMFEYSVLTFTYGSSYFDYILRSPPDFMYHNRPADLSAIFFDRGYPSIGGFFELAEAYLNFGIIGCLIMPFAISFFIGTCYRKTLDGQLFWFILLMAMLSVFFRGAWYQTFAFYKGCLTGIILYMGFYSIQVVFPDYKWINNIPRSIKFK